MFFITMLAAQNPLILSLVKIRGFELPANCPAKSKPLDAADSLEIEQTSGNVSEVD